MVLILNLKDETNPSYYILFNKLESGDLKINLNNGTYIQNIIIKDSNPYRGIYVNRKNLFKECADTEPYICTLNMNITGENISFTLLIRDAQESDSYPTYFIPNEMILGMSESFSPLYFYTDINHYISILILNQIVKEKYLLIIKKEEILFIVKY